MLRPRDSGCDLCCYLRDGRGLHACSTPHETHNGLKLNLKKDGKVMAPLAKMHLHPRETSIQGSSLHAHVPGCTGIEEERSIWSKRRVGIREAYILITIHFKNQTQCKQQKVIKITTWSNYLMIIVVLNLRRLLCFSVDPSHHLPISRFCFLLVSSPYSSSS